MSVYSSSASPVAGIPPLISGFGFWGVLGLYSLYLLYLGTPVLMNAPEVAALAYTVLTRLAAVVLFLVIGLVSGASWRRRCCHWGRPAPRSAITTPIL